MRPQDRLVGIAGVILVFVAAYAIIGTGNAGQVIGGAVELSDDLGVQSIETTPDSGFDEPASTSHGQSVEATPIEAAPVLEELVTVPPISFNEYREPTLTEGMMAPKYTLILENENVPEFVKKNDQFSSKNPSVIGSVRRVKITNTGEKISVDKYIPNSVIVQFETPVSNQRQSMIASSIDVKLKQIGEYSIKKLAPTHEADALSRFAVINFKGEPHDMEILLNRISKIAGVATVSPNYIARTSQTISAQTSSQGIPAVAQPINPNDPYFSLQYMHHKIDSISAWRQTRGSGSVIAVIDTGVDWHHEDLQGNIWQNPGEIPNNGIDDEGNGYIDDIIGYDFVDTFPDPLIPQEDFLNEDNDPSDYYGHGTHVAGIIAAVTDNQKGIAGVCPECKIMAIRAGFAPGLLTYADIIQGIIYAVDNGADVINMSFGGEDSPAEKAALDYAYAQGVVLVASAGNESSNTLLYPGAYENVIGVTATDSANTMAWFSNYGYWTDVAAPGVGILSTVPTNGYYLSMYCPPLAYDSKYANCSGTSMAAPVVAGVAGLVHAVSPWNSVAIAQSGIASGVKTFQEDLSNLPTYFMGNGIIDSLRAINRSQRDTTALVSIDDSSVSGAIYGDATIQGSALSSSFGSVTFTLYDLTSQTPLSGYSTQLTHPVTNGNLTTLPSATLPNGEYIVRGTQRNSSGQVVRLIQKPIKLVNLEVNNPVPNLAVNPNNGPISFTGTVSGSSLIQYTLEYRTDPNQPFSSQGFTYTNNTTSKTNELLATWIPPASFPPSATTEFRLTANYPNQTNMVNYFYLIDQTLKQGWPVNFSNTSNLFSINWSSPTIIPWNDVSGAVNTAFTTTIDYYGPNTTEIHVLDPNGNEAPGWPQILPQTLGSLYNWGESGDILTLADVDNDGRDELLVRSEYTDDYTETQTAVFAYNEDGTMANGFPILTNFPLVAGMRILHRGPLIAADIDLDGKKELIAYSANEVSGVNQYSLIGIAKQNNQGNYLFSTFMVQILMTGDIYFGSEPATIVVQNMDSDPNLEIMGVALDSVIDAGGYYDFGSFIFGINQDGSSVSGWPQTIGDPWNHTVLDKIYTISGGIMNGNPVLAAVGYTYNTTSSIGNYVVYLFNKDGTQLSSSPISIPIGQGAANLSFPSIFSNAAGSSDEELVIALTNAVNAYDAQGNIVWQGTTPYPGFGFWGPMMSAERAGNRVLTINYWHPEGVAGTPSSFESVGFEPSTGQTATMSKNINVVPYGFVRFGGMVLIPTAPINELAQAVSLQNGTYSAQWFQLLRWASPTDLELGDWPMYLHDVSRINSSAVEDCVTPTDGMFITQTTRLCAGDYSLPNGITVWAMGNEPVSLVCYGTNMRGTNTVGSVGVSVNNATPGQGTVSVEGCAIEQYATGISVNRHVNFMLYENNLSNNTTGILVSPPMLSNYALTGTLSTNIITNSADAIKIMNYPNVVLLSNQISEVNNGIILDQSNGVDMQLNFITAKSTSTGSGIKATATNSGKITHNTFTKFPLNIDLALNANFWTIHTNSFYKKLGATANVKDVGSSNVWYNTSTNKGNYWSDHACTDNQPPFGVCENAYVIDPNSKDLKPLKYSA